MFKFLIRRIRFGMAGKFIRLFQALLGTILVSALLLFFMGGSFSQKEFFGEVFSVIWKTSEDVAEKIQEGDLPVTITDEGVYLKGKEKGNKIDLNGEDAAVDAVEEKAIE